MPSALETLVKILKLEREQGCENRAVIGGLAAFAVNWKRQAQAQARRPEHHVLADEVSELLLDYEHVESQLERMRQIDYMLDRITGRAPTPAKYQEKLAASEISVEENKAKAAAPPPPSPVVESYSVHDGEYEDERNKSLESYGYDNFQPVAAQQLDIPLMERLERPPRKPRDFVPFEEAKKRLQELQRPVSEVNGIGHSKTDDFAKLGIRTIEDMLRYLPRRYDNYTKLKYISKLAPDEIVTVIGTISHTELRAASNGRKDFHMVLDDGSASMNVTFFGQHFLAKTLRKGLQVVLSGKTTVWRNRVQMSNPEWERMDSENLHTIGIIPVYGLTEGLNARGFRRLMKKAIDQYADYVPDHLPEAVLERADVADLNWTLKNIHFPEGEDHLHHARDRWIFDQLLLLQLGVLRNRRDWQSVAGEVLTVDDGWYDELLASIFPYELTGAQQRALNEIRRDLAKPVPMNRLLQGDVGAGKTAVALAAMAMAIHNGKQAAIMAPTSILAEQHYRSMGKALEQMPHPYRPVVALLTSALTSSERESVYRGIADGSIDIVIGTHALIQSGVDFKHLAVAVIDEQHRFGVQQRAALRGKGMNPHLLVMSATPIPRTLALTMYADLDLSILDEKPAGRQAIETRMVHPKEREQAFGFIGAQVGAGRQAFIIHPLVEASEKIEARSAIEAYEELKQVFHQYRVCLLHGRMRPEEKEEIMGAFAKHQYDVMVTTSVAEVGVDVPNASAILIEGANRFGLAQLHQFRGRVGRGEHKSFCLLIPDKFTPEAQERLQALEKTNDGFILAELDWSLRGAGDLLGTRQAGGQVLQLAEYMRPELVKLAQQEARALYEEDPYLEQAEHRLLKEKVDASLEHEGGDVS